MPSERVFSTAGDIVTAQRSALKFKDVEKNLGLVLVNVDCITGIYTLIFVHIHCLKCVFYSLLLNTICHQTKNPRLCVKGHQNKP